MVATRELGMLVGILSVVVVVDDDTADDLETASCYIIFQLISFAKIY